MTIDDEVTVRRLLILAYAGLDERSIFQAGKAEGDIFADVFQRCGIDDAFAVGGIEVRAPGVVGDFESTAVAAGDAVTEFSSVVGPDWGVGIVKSGIARWSAEEEDILLGGTNEVANRAREQLPKPGPAGKDVEVGSELRADGK